LRDRPPVHATRDRADQPQLDRSGFGLADPPQVQALGHVGVPVLCRCEDHGGASAAGAVEEQTPSLHLWAPAACGGYGDIWPGQHWFHRSWSR
jgi:hypothetical protein